MRLLSIKKILAILLLPLLLYSCSKKEHVSPKNNNIPNKKLLQANKWVYEMTTAYYLWEKYIPGDIDVTTYENPQELFEAMYYPKLDKWSFVTDDYNGLMNSLNGKRKASGFKFKPFLYKKGEKGVYIFVQYVHKDGSAFKSGLKRGNIIIKINGEKLTTDNLNQLLANSVLKLSIAEYKNEKIVDLNKTVTVNKIDQEFSPFLKDTIINKGGKKIGYFLFDQFISKYDKNMIDIFRKFKNKGINDLVVDLRYNSGGYVSTCILLGSMIAPQSCLKQVFLKNIWNDIITENFGNNPQYKHLFSANFMDTVPVNLNLQNLYVLCSKGSASASESLINCLKPYINVVLIGKPTHGKYTAVNVFNDKKVPALANWGIFLVTSKIANANGKTDYINGLTPDFEVEDNFITPLGDENEPLLAKALQQITGSTSKKTLLELPKDMQFMENSFSESKYENMPLMILDNLKFENK